MRKGVVFTVLAAVSFGQVLAQNTNKFKQLKEELSTPNVYRTASGAPGHDYYQQQANYVMKIELDDEKQIIRGVETVTYINNSPDALSYLWVQLDQNMRAKDSDSKKISTMDIQENLSFSELKRMHNDFDGGFKIDYIKDKSNKDINYTVNKTMLRIDLKTPLQPKASYTFKIKWWYNINDRMQIGGRSGFEHFEDNDNYLYTIAQFYPRMAVYNEVEGWQNKQFLGHGEFALAFGDYDVSITVPEDHVVAATGVLQNPNSVLSSKQRNRLAKAKNEFETPVFIVTEDEAKEAETKKASGKKTWQFKAKNVRDFGFASSRKFIWDAMTVKQESGDVLAMSFYPKEGNPLWERYSTKVVAHTIRTYSKYTFDYPYPVAISVHSKRIGMEYPMICFNGGRPESDGTYSERTKYSMLGVIIHEVGHNYFPMIVNSDERQWTWMDEGLNTFLQYLTEQEWERGYPSRRGPAYKITDYMGGDKRNISPIMTNSESVLQFGNNAYGKPATALNILRETVMGRELFDHAFKTYANRWMFKHPTPADFFRTMEDASGVDLDWFWRGWFYTTDHCDIAIDNIQHFKVNSGDPEKEKAFAKQMDDQNPGNRFIGDERNKKDIKETMNEKDPTLNDFYVSYDPFKTTILDQQQYSRFLSSLSQDEKGLLNNDYNYYQIDLSNVGGLVMPVILEFTFTDGSTEVMRIPAEIWARNNEEVSKVVFFKRELMGVTLDPFVETADCDLNNNFWPSRVMPSKFQLFKQRSTSGENLMQRSRRIEEMKGGSK